MTFTTRPPPAPMQQLHHGAEKTRRFDENILGLSLYHGITRLKPALRQESTP